MGDEELEDEDMKKFVRLVEKSKKIGKLLVKNYKL
jgi:hypothetical protein